MIDNLAQLHKLQSLVVCPHCWGKFRPEEVLWISTHPNLKNDIKVKSNTEEEQMARFLPSRFTIEGAALDAEGSPCHDLACPNCHLLVPMHSIQLQPLFVSIVGAPGSGKSVMLGAMIRDLRRRLGRDFKVGFEDAEASMNANISYYEKSFNNILKQPQNTFIEIKDIIQKTKDSALSNTVQFYGGEKSFPSPYVYALKPGIEHPYFNKAESISRLLCLYDNAGESFEPGKDNSQQPYTRHIAEAHVLMLVIDPMQSELFKKEMETRNKKSDIGMLNVNHANIEWDGRKDSYNQEECIQEIIARIRKYSMLRTTDTFKNPLIVCLTKHDGWWEMLGNQSSKVKPSDIDYPSRVHSNSGCHLLQESIIRETSDKCQKLIRETSPEIDNAIRNFAHDVTYIPVSAIGMDSHLVNGKFPALEGSKDPVSYWGSLPIIYAISKATKGLIASKSM